MNEFNLIPSNPALKTKKHGNKIEAKIEKINELNQILQTLKSDFDYLVTSYVQHIQETQSKLIQIEQKEIIFLDKVFDENVLSKRDTKLLSELILTKANDILEWIDSKEIIHIQEKHFNFSQKYKTTETGSNNDIEEFQQSKLNQNSSEFDTELASKSRKIYLELVKKFHPDLSVNSFDEKEKTDIMQEVTAAYQENDWIKLINLKSKLLHSEASIRQTDEDLLKILDKNVLSLETEIDEIRAKGNHFFPENKLFDKEMPKRRVTIDILIRTKSKELAQILKDKKKNLHFYGNANHVSVMLDYFRKMN